MTAKVKQQFILAAGIFLAASSIGFSFQGKSFLWFWQEYPFIPVLMLGFVFFAVKFWLKLEIDRQREIIQINQASPNGLETMLSEREKEVMQLISEGLSNREIAEKLYVSISTVKTHINNIYKILQVSDRRAAIEKFENGP